MAYWVDCGLTDCQHHVAYWLDSGPTDCQHHVAYWVDTGPTDCQHHDGHFDKSCRTFAKGKSTRCCSQKLFYGIKANGEQYRRELLLYSPSTGSVCQTFGCQNGLSYWKNNSMIDNHEQSGTHMDSIITYLTRRQGLSLLQRLGKQINEEYS